MYWFSPWSLTDLVDWRSDMHDCTFIHLTFCISQKSLCCGPYGNQRPLFCSPFLRQQIIDQFWGWRQKHKRKWNPRERKCTSKATPDMLHKPSKYPMKGSIYGIIYRLWCRWKVRAGANGPLDCVYGSVSICCRQSRKWPVKLVPSQTMLASINTAHLTTRTNEMMVSVNHDRQTVQHKLLGEF